MCGCYDTDGAECTRLLGKALREFNSLKTFHVRIGSSSDKVAYNLISALEGHTFLTTLGIYSNDKLGKKGFAALASLLRKRNSNITQLHLESEYEHINNWHHEHDYRGATDDEGVIAISSPWQGRI